MGHLTTRLVILLMLALMAITGAFDYLRLARERDRLVHLDREDLRIFAETLALAVSRNVRRGRTTEELKELLDEIVKRPDVVWVVIYDPHGHAVTSSTASMTPPDQGDEAVTTALRTRAPVSRLVAGSGGRVIEHVQPLRWSDGRTAGLEIRQGLQSVEHEFARAIRERIIARLVILAFFVLSVVAVTRWSVIRPIRALIRAARAVGRGDLAQRIDVSRRDEIGELAAEFNRMSENLARARHDLLQQSEERLRLERELQQAQKLGAVGMLAAEVAHELGTPLNVVSGRAEALARAVPPDHAARRHVDAILGQTERITGIIRALLDYTRPRRPTFREEAVAPLLSRVIDLLDGRYRDKDVAVVLALPPALPRVLADADQLQQVFLNIIVNALDASPPRGVIRVITGPEPVLTVEDRVGIVRGKLEGPCLAIHVVDEGPGMTAEQLAHVFEPFFSTKKRGQGTGLGLPIVEEIVRAHRGEVEVLSAPGRGAEVIVRLPVASASSAPSLAESPSVATHGR